VSFFEVIPAGTKIDFIGRRKISASISALVLLVGIVAVFTRGVHYGIDFAGGTEMQVLFTAESGADEGAIRSVCNACGVKDASVVRYGETDQAEFLIRFRMDDAGERAAAVASADCPLTEADRASLAEAAAAGGGAGDVGEKGELVDRLALALTNAVGPLEVERVEYVGPRVGAELRRDGPNGSALQSVSQRISIGQHRGAIRRLWPATSVLESGALRLQTRTTRWISTRRRS